MRTQNIEGYPNYLISDEGNVYSKNYRRLGLMKELKPGISQNGYLTVSFLGK